MEGREEEKPITTLGETPSPAVPTQGLLLTQVTSSNWEALSRGKASLALVSLALLPGLHPDSCVEPTGFSASQRCVAPTSCHTEQRCNMNSRVNPSLEFKVFIAKFKVTGVVARAQGQIPNTPISHAALN